MSRLFQKSSVPDSFIDILEILDDYMQSETREKSQLFARLSNNKRSGLPKLPKDIWKMILIEVCKLDSIFDPDSWYHDAYQWFWNWLKTPDLQRLNPLLIVDNTTNVPFNPVFTLHWMNYLYKNCCL